MKRLSLKFLFLTLSTLLFMSAKSQNPVKNYDVNWKKVEGFVNKGLPKSALDEVKNIYALAKKDKQDAQVIKALVYMTTLQDETREENESFSIAELEKETAGSKEPVTSLLNSLQADVYWNYYRQHRYQFYNRTQTADFKKEDIATWTAEDFHKKVSELYLASIKNEKLLQATKLEPFEAIITKGNSRNLRPTLYDLLAFKSLSYFENDERDVNKPAYAFEIDQASAFDPAADFITRKFSTKDSLSLQHKALLTYQKLIAFHINDARPDALIDADLQRLEFVKSKSVHPDKDQLYFNAINHIANQYASVPAAAQAWFLVAAYYEQKAITYKPYGDTTQRFARLKAKEICEKLLTQKDSSEGKVNAYNLLNQINSKTLGFSVEKVNVPSQAFRALVAYKNFTQLYLRLVQVDENFKKVLQNQYDEKFWPAVIAAKSFKTWEQALPDTKDLQQHSVEIKVDALPIGTYMLVAGTDKDFNNKKTVIGARVLYVSNISYVNNADDFFLLNRDNGQPLAAAAVQVYKQEYDYKLSKYITTKDRLYKTDNNGFFKREKTSSQSTRNGNQGYLFDISTKNDRLFMDDAMNDYYYRGDDVTVAKTYTSIFLFTDRAIYRPGQTVFFKGIVLKKNTKEKLSDIVTDYETTVYLRDANAQEVGSMKLKTNEFGSFSGKFQLPSSGITGQFSVYTKTDNSSAQFRVEEYKRPKFFVDYEPIKGSYRVNDKITITGNAKAYAGNNVDAAMVKYRVVRQPRFIYYWMFWRGWQPPTEALEITHGEMKTDKDGKFKIEFQAIPDLKIDKKLEPVFDYTVYADVTDINGETRSGEQRVSVSYKSLMIQANIPETLPVDSLKKLSIRTQNNNSVFEPAVVKVSIARLKEEKRLIRARFWERPDQFTMSKESYVQSFPFDEYDNETDNKSWEAERPLLEKSDSTKESGEFAIGNGKFTPGYYRVTITTKDRNGEEVKDVKYMELIDEKSKLLNRPQYLWTAGSDPIEPGEKTNVRLGTSADNLFLIQSIDKEGMMDNGKGLSYSFSKLNNEKRAIEFTATEADRGGYGATWLFIKNNRVYQYEQTITVPWSNKRLDIEYASFRDKTLPGSEEKWKLKISGYKNEKVASEILASMYDASLDQFAPHSWNLPDIYSYYYSNRSWNTAQNFEEVTAMPLTRYYPEPKNWDKQYDYLLSISGYGNGGSYPMMAEGVQVMRSAAPGSVSDIRIRGVASDQSSEGKNKAAKKEVAFENDSMVLNAAPTAQAGSEAAIQVRKNFNETAFFFPDLRTDSSGSIEFSFTIPEALTKWKFQSIAHTKGLAFGYSSKEIITQKQLMVQPNPTRFLREGDKMEFSAKIVNLTDKELTGSASFELFDAATNEPVDGIFHNSVANQYFTVTAAQSEAVRFPMEVPYQFNKALTWRIVAKAKEFSDGEENSLPVLTNRMLVTETLSLPMRGSGTRNFKFAKLLAAGNSETLQQHALTIEYTSNPAWYAIQSLPYLMEYPYECAEQTWNRYYANSVATYIANSSPKIKQVFERWKITDTAALMSNLQKNEELKAVLLEETPWVLQAKTEAEQKKNIALLFDMVKMSGQLNSSFDKLKQMQSSNGGFVWFKGGADDRYMTQYIVTGIGHLKKLNAYASGQEAKLKQILALAIPYLDRKIKEDYDNLVKYKTDLKKYAPGYSEIQYLYMRSFFPEYKIADPSLKAYNYFKGRLPLTWTQTNKYMQGMTALFLSRSGDVKTPAAILKSLKETSINNEELGMYWKDASRSWWWYEAPIERQALLIEAFQEAGKDNKTADDLRTWLLKNKQTNSWESTKATAEACYALLLQGTNWINEEPTVKIQLGNVAVSSTDNKQEAGTGYFKKTIEGNKIDPSMGNISVTVTPSKATAGANSLPTWGGVYWQYFEDLAKITEAATPLKLGKKLFIETNSDRGPVLTPVVEGTVIKIGDKVKVRIELKVDRDMEYVHMKDMRASALEPVNVLSNYKYQDGLGYYESTKDASTNFFFGNLRKGTYVFEYALFATHAGNFSNGVTTIQCMYAPEFSAHSEGVRVNVE